MRNFKCSVSILAVLAMIVAMAGCGYGVPDSEPQMPVETGITPTSKPEAITQESLPAQEETQTENAEAVTETVMAPVATYVPGDVVAFGAYEQDNDLNNGVEPIEWRVVAAEDEKVFLVSRYILDCQPYNTTVENVTWETCSLRKWLNNDFMLTAFTKQEQSGILLTELINQDNPKFGTLGGNNTSDKVFLLSETELREYFPGQIAWRTLSSAYCQAKQDPTKLPFVRFFAETYEYWDWWLRSPGQNSKYAAAVSNIEEIDYRVAIVDNAAYGVCPAIWVDVAAVDNALTLIEKNTTVFPTFEEEQTQINAAQVGDIVVLGKYEQDNNLENRYEPLEWIVLAKEEGKALLITRFGLDWWRFAAQHGDAANWRRSSIREWMNDDFIHEAFTEEEAALLQVTTLHNHSRYRPSPPIYFKWSDPDTEDRVFLMSAEEVETYWPDHVPKSVEDTPFALNEVLTRAEKNRSHTNGWGLRTPGREEHYYWYIREDGERVMNDTMRYSLFRPAVWVECGN